MPDAFPLNLSKNRAEECAVFIRSPHLPAHVTSAERSYAVSAQQAASGTDGSGMPRPDMRTAGKSTRAAMPLPPDADAPSAVRPHGASSLKCFGIFRRFAKLPERQRRCGAPVLSGRASYRTRRPTDGGTGSILPMKKPRVLHGLIRMREGANAERTAERPKLLCFT